MGSAKKEKVRLAPKTMKALAWFLVLLVAGPGTANAGEPRVTWLGGEREYFGIFKWIYRPAGGRGPLIQPFTSRVVLRDPVLRGPGCRARSGQPWTSRVVLSGPVARLFALY